MKNNITIIDGFVPMDKDLLNKFFKEIGGEINWTVIPTRQTISTRMAREFQKHPEFLYVTKKHALSMKFKMWIMLQNIKNYFRNFKNKMN